MTEHTHTHKQASLLTSHISAGFEFYPEKTGLHGVFVRTRTPE